MEEDWLEVEIEVLVAMIGMFDDEFEQRQHVLVAFLDVLCYRNDFTSFGFRDERSNKANVQGECVVGYS